MRHGGTRAVARAHSKTHFRKTDGATAGACAAATPRPPPFPCVCVPNTHCAAHPKSIHPRERQQAVGEAAEWVRRGHHPTPHPQPSLSSPAAHTWEKPMAATAAMPPQNSTNRSRHKTSVHLRSLLSVNTGCTSAAVFRRQQQKMQPMLQAAAQHRVRDHRRGRRPHPRGMHTPRHREQNEPSK